VNSEKPLKNKEETTSKNVKTKQLATHRRSKKIDITKISVPQHHYRMQPQPQPTAKETDSNNLKKLPETQLNKVRASFLLEDNS
jgi:hypothetical protein